MHFCCCITNFTIAIIAKTILLLSSVIFRSKCRMGDIHYKSKMQLTCSQTLIHLNGSTLTLTYCPPMTNHIAVQSMAITLDTSIISIQVNSSYTWTCLNGPCEVEGYYGRKVYNEHILAVKHTITLTKSFQNA